MNKKIEEFYSNFNHNIRLIIDDLSGIIFEEYPNVKEKIQKDKLNYIDVEKGKFVQIKPNYLNVKIIFLKLKKELIYNNSNEINFNQLRSLLKE